MLRRGRVRNEDGMEVLRVNAENVRACRWHSLFNEVLSG